MIIEDKKLWVHKHIDKEFFELNKNKYYRDETKTNKELGGKKEILLHQLKYENIGEYSDLNIDIKTYQNFNNQFNFMEKVEASYDPNTENNLVDFMQEVLENPGDPLYQKYQDESLTDKQFEDAKKEILNDNEKKPKRDPKPTNHLLIPLPCDLKADYHQFENSMEQTYLIQFFEEYLKKTETIPVLEKHIAYHFCRDVFRECLGCFSNKEDGQFNKQLFYEKDEKMIEYRKKYKILQEKITIIWKYKRDKKLDKKLLKKYNYPFKLDSDEEKKQTIDQVMKDIEFDSTVHKQNLSFREFCRQSGYIKGDDDKSYIWSNKTIRIDERSLSAGSRTYFEQAGVKKQLKLGEKPKDTKDEKKKEERLIFL